MLVGHPRSRQRYLRRARGVSCPPASPLEEKVEDGERRDIGYLLPRMLEWLRLGLALATEEKIEEN